MTRKICGKAGMGVWTAIRAGAAAAAAAAVLVGCGAWGAMETGDAAPDGRKIIVDVPDGGFAEPARWPEACSLLTEEELRGILPDLKRVAIRSEAGVADVPAAAAGGSTLDGRTVPRAKCTYDMVLPLGVEGARTRREPDNGTGSFSIRLLAVGAPGRMANVYEAGRDRDTRPLQGVSVDDCYQTGALIGAKHLICHRGPLVFEVKGGDFDYVRIDGVSHHEQEFPEAVRNHILIPVVETIGADV
ncbi:hypothetical protein [Actinomadura rifamycini]|uniref:hypothetical protein n=1 Tax=Actinomadura rifamycini TaxID=31962 RepID=UPI0012FCC052|nr:hypothetical protein [Actinomadura rifamycini]